jgi:glycosyltransferase involved in cell wall biosynthesis
MKFFILSYIYDRIVKDDMGGYRKVYELAENLEKLGHEAVLFIPKLKNQSIPVRFVQIPILDIPIIRPVIFNILLFFYLLYHTLRIHPSILYTRPINSFIPLLVAKLTSIYFVMEVNGDQCHHLRSIGAHQLKIALVRLIEHINFKFADKIIPITQGLRQMIRTKHGITDSKISVIESGSNLDLFKPMDMEACKKFLNLDSDYNYVGFVGTFFKYQGIDTLIDSAGEVISRAPETKFLIVGDGVMRTEWMQKTRKIGLEDRFVFPGQVPYNKVPYYINAMTVCVAPFTANRGETSPLKLFDYFACAKPVVSSDIPSIHQTLLDSKAAILVSPDDPVALAQALIGILKNEKKQRTLVNNGRKFVVSKYSWEAQVKSLISVIEDDIFMKGKTGV